jgi:hypothetical protein
LHNADRCAGTGVGYTNFSKRILNRCEKIIGLIKTQVKRKSNNVHRANESHHHGLFIYEHCSQMPSKTAKTESRSFPRKLHALLEEAEEKGFQDLICWQSGGKSFKVLNSRHFAKTIMPKYFKQTKFKSFQRQLNIYGFQRIHHGPNKGGYAHDCLIQGIPELCLLFIRQGARDSKAVSAKKLVRESGFGSVPSLPSTRSIQNVSFLLRTARSSSFSSVLLVLGDARDCTATPCLLTASSSILICILQTSLCTSFALNKVKQIPDKQNEVFKWDGPDFKLLPKSLESFDLNGPGCTSSNGNKMNGASELNEFCDLFRPSAFDEKPLVCSSMDFDKNADVVTNCCHIQDVIQDVVVEEASFPIEPSAHDELFSLLNEDDECSEDLQQKSESVFPAKLHRMLENTEKDGLEPIVSWVQRGTAFKVHDTEEFVRRIMPLYFDQTKYESFRRQLNLYEFSRVSQGASRGAYYHQMFVQSDPLLCQNINRPKSRIQQSQP